MQSTVRRDAIAKINVSSLVYISICAPRSQATSKYFLQYHLSGGIVALIKEVSITATSRISSFGGMIFNHVVAAVIQEFLLGKATCLNNGPIFRSILPAVDKVKGIFPFLEVVVSFGRDNLKESIGNACSRSAFGRVGWQPCFLPGFSITGMLTEWIPSLPCIYSTTNYMCLLLAVQGYRVH